MKKSNLMPSVVLSAICLVAALLLSVINTFTSAKILKNQEEKANQAFTEVLPGATGKTDIALDSSYPASVTAAYKFDNGYVFQMEVTGYKSGLIIMCGVDNEGKVSGVKHIQTNETYGMEAELNGAYTGDTLDTLELVLATGATKNSKTSGAYYEAIKAALQSYVIANGGAVDIRTPEQILQDNCNAALGTSDVSFTKWFATEELEGVDAVYVASDNSGYVFAIGEAFIGVNASGTVVTADVSEENATAVATAYTTVTSSTLTEMTDLPEGISADVIKAYSTASGNYVFEVKAYGYKYSTNMEFAGIDAGHFYIKVSISADGKIIDCLTTSHEESSGYGDMCATEEYYEQYRGAENGDITLSVVAPDFHEDQLSDSTEGIGVIASSTFTTYGYQKAVKAAFTAYELITEGGSN